MKKVYLLLLFVFGFSTYAQQKGISYQAVITNPNEIKAPGYNATAIPLANKGICMSFKIVNSANQVEYQESQAIMTDAYGMINVVIGTGRAGSGLVSTLEAVAWNQGNKKLVVGVNTDGVCSNYTEISNQVLNYTPYSFYALNADLKDGYVTDVKVAMGINPAKVGLGNVNNTSDANKPVSTATQTALNLKANTTDVTNGLALKEDISNKSSNIGLDAGSTTKYPSVKAIKDYVDAQTAAAGVADGSITSTKIANGTIVNADVSPTAAIDFSKLNIQKSDIVGLGLTKSDIGLTNVDNTSDANKPVSTATQTALNLKEDKSNKSVTTTLGTSNVLYPTQNAVKTYVDTAIAGATIVDADATTKGKIKLTGDLAGTADLPTVPGLALKADNSSLSTVATSGNYNDLTNKPSIPSAYALPTASASELGGVKVGTGLTITNGVLSSSGSGVPYTGATQAVDLGAFDLKVNGMTVGNGKNGYEINVALGKNALSNTITGFQANYLTAVGFEALKNDTWGYFNTAIGSSALFSNTTGLANTAVGSNSLYYNTTANYNTAVGTGALRNNTDGSSNTANGASALESNTTGSTNTAIGTGGLKSNVTGWNNSSVGSGALSSSNTNNNTAMGTNSLKNTTGYSNTALGYAAGEINTTGNENTAIGATATFGTNNLSNATAIGFNAIVTASNTIQLGNTAVTNVKTSGTITAGAVTYPKVDGTAGQVLTANANGVPTWQPIAASPLASPTFTGTPTAPTAAAGTNTTQIATTEFVTGAIATATIADATTSAKGKIRLAGDLGGTADVPTVPGLVLKANASDVTTSLATKEDASNKSNAALGTSTTLYPTQNAVKTYVDAQVASATIAASNITGILPISAGGTGLASTPSNGQIDIGNATGFTRTTLTAGTGITISNGVGSITINAAARSWSDQPTTVSANQTTFTLTYSPPTSVKVWMFINGVRTNNNAYSVSGTTLTYTPASNGGYAITSSDRIQFDYTY